MDSDEEQAKKIQKIVSQNQAIFAEMGLLASDWAMLEFEVNELIWQLANVTPVLGACVTAQIFNINNRLLAVISLMRVRGFDEKFVDEINRFMSNVRDPAEARNRVIHDPVIVNVASNSLARLEITAQRKPKFEAALISFADLRKTRADILKYSCQFLDFRKRVLAMLPTLPEIPKSSSLPINLSLLIPIEDQPNER